MRSLYADYAEEWKRLYENCGLSIRQIADLYKIKHQNVRYQLYKSGVSFRYTYKQFSSLLSEWIALYSDSGLSTYEIANRYGVDRTTVCNYLRDNGVQIREPGGYRGDLAERFWEKIERSDHDDCWNWTGARTNAGYGIIWYEGKNIGAHRLSYLIHRGEIPDSLFVCHSCDNPSCVNPAHLWLGTAGENTRDMVVKKRNPVGSAVGTALLDVEKVKSARRDFASGKITFAELAKKYGVSATAIRDAIRKKTWKHV